MMSVGEWSSVGDGSGAERRRDEGFGQTGRGGETVIIKHVVRVLIAGGGWWVGGRRRLLLMVGGWWVLIAGDGYY